MTIYINKKPMLSANWIRLNRYCEMTGDTPAAVHARRHKGHWINGKHTILGPDGKLWVDLKEAQKWVEHGNKVK